MHCEARHVQAHRGEARGKEHEPASEARQQAVVELRGGRERERHQDDEPYDRRQEREEPQELAEHDLGHRDRRGHEQHERLVAPFLGDEPHREQRHREEEHRGCRSEGRRGDELGRARRARHLDELGLDLREVVEPPQERVSDDQLHHRQDHHARGEANSVFSSLPAIVKIMSRRPHGG